MVGEAERLGFAELGSSSDPLADLKETPQARFLRTYLRDLGVQKVLWEPRYFDRDYLDDFATFYSVSAGSYPNLCSRLHYFADLSINRRTLSAAAGGSTYATNKLQKAYRGFTVLRPIPAARLGRTVLAWYPDHTPATPRVTTPSRAYKCHVAGVELTVDGIAWQQQDSGVGGCATVAVWSMLQSSGHDEWHGIPTTAAVTRLGHRTASLGTRVFPSAGLTIFQVCEAIKECGLAPVVCQGDVQFRRDRETTTAFSRERLNNLVASLVRSGYPAMLCGRLEGVGLHAVCVVGFREPKAREPMAGALESMDAMVEHYYVHDDNIGPNVRFRLADETAKARGGGSRVRYVALRRSRPPDGSNTPDYPAFIPGQIVAAVSNELRTSPDALSATALAGAQTLRNRANGILAKRTPGAAPLGLTVSMRFAHVQEYIGDELGRLLSSQRGVLSRTRLALYESVPPLSLHLGVARIGYADVALIDVLYDTTDRDRYLPSFCSVGFHEWAALIAEQLSEAGHECFGPVIRAYDSA